MFVHSCAACNQFSEVPLLQNTFNAESCNRCDLGLCPLGIYFGPLERDVTRDDLPYFLPYWMDWSLLPLHRFSEQGEIQYNKYWLNIKMPLRFLVQIVQTVLLGTSFQRCCTQRYAAHFNFSITSVLHKLFSALWKTFYFLIPPSPKQSKVINAICYWWALQAWEEKAPGRTYSTFLVPKGATRDLEKYFLQGHVAPGDKGEWF